MKMVSPTNAAPSIRYVTHAGVCPRRVPYGAIELTDLKNFLVAEQTIELAAVLGETRLGVEQLAKRRLHRADSIADTGLPTQLALEVARRGQVIRMYVGSQDPHHRQPLAANEFDEPIRGRRR